MKKLILVLIALIAISLLSSCIKIYMPDDNRSDTNTDTQTDSPNNIVDNQQKTEPLIYHTTIQKDIYPSYDLEDYRGNGFDSEVVTAGVAKYEILQDYEEASNDTDYGIYLDKTIFDDHYILAIYFPYDSDKAGIVGLKNLISGSGGSFVTVLNNGNGAIPAKKYFYFKVPKTELSDWYGQGTIQLRKETIEYAKTKQISISNDFMKNDGELLLLSRQELKDYIVEKELPVRIEEIPVEKSYIICFSKKCFDSTLLFTKPTINEGIVTLSRDFDVSKYRAERAFLDIIPLEVEDKSTVKKIELTSELLDNGEFFAQDYQITNTALTYHCADFYKTFRGGVYYGTELAEIQHSSYTIIETYRELLDKTEFYIDEEIFNDNYVLVLKLIGVSPQRLGFTNAHAGLIDAMEGSKSGCIEIELYVTPYYEQILNDSIEDIKEEIYDEEYDKNRVEYEYIIVPKSHLRNVRKTGVLNIYTNTTFSYSFEPNIIKKEFDNTDYSIVSGNTWRITTKLEMEDFNKKFGTSFKTNYIGKNYGREYIIVYLEDNDEYEILQTVTKETDTLYYLSYLVEKKEETSNEKRGYFLCIEKDASSVGKQLIIERTIITHSGSCPSYSVEKEIKAYDHYEMEISYSKNVDFKYLVLTDYAKLEEIFNEYKYYEAEETTADKIFAPSIFENNYVVVFSGYYDNINTYYNARIGGNGALYLYAFEGYGSFDDYEHQTLTFVSIPKEELSKPINGIKIEYTKEPVFNGPFENVTISSTNSEDVKLEQEFVLINSENELKEILSSYKDYKKLQSIDFENYFILAFNRHYYTTAEYLYGDFVNFKTTVYGTASITFMSEENVWLTDGIRTYVLDLVIIPREYLKHEICYFHVRYATYSVMFEYDDIDRIDTP